MSNTNKSSSRVTVTLGPTGRVVKRVGEDRYSNGVLMTRKKRSVSDRSGDDLDDRRHKYYERQRGDGIGPSSSNDMHLDKHDLRFKLLKKNKSRQSTDDDSHSNFDLRDKLIKKNSQSSARNKTVHQPETPVSTPEPTNSQSSILGRFPSSRNASELSLLGPLRTYSLRRSPERLLQPSTPRAMSSDRSREELSRKQLVRAHDDVRYSSSPLTRSSVPDAPLKSVVPPPLFSPQSSGILQKMQSLGSDHPTVESLLEFLGLGKYAILFKAEEIDMNTLRHLSESDLKGMGIPMLHGAAAFLTYLSFVWTYLSYIKEGPRKKILQAVMSRPRRLP